MFALILPIFLTTLSVFSHSEIPDEALYSAIYHRRLDSIVFLLDSQPTQLTSIHIEIALLNTPSPRVEDNYGPEDIVQLEKADEVVIKVVSLLRERGAPWSEECALVHPISASGLSFVLTC